MANIKLNDLSTQNLSSPDLIEGSESFLTELNDGSNWISKQALARVVGGGITISDRAGITIAERVKVLISD
jgi:hypothetical protein